ncbi:MAG: hypothetical protein AAGD35_14525 [Actinomycetota bacterium]
MPHRILFVCTANICRSPTAELLARSRYGESGVLVRSAGFLRSGEGSPDLLLQALNEAGVDGSAHRSFTLNAASLDAADLVLTMEGEHVQKATLLHREAYPKIIPLTEAADRARRHAHRSLAPSELVDIVGAERDPSSYLTTTWDVSDPYNRKLKDYRRAVVEISQLVDDVFTRLT